jgi:hypothetical protein
MLPANARRRHPIVEKRLKDLKTFAETFSENRVEWGDRKVGIITSGISYQYAKEILPNASYLKLGMVYPLDSFLSRRWESFVVKSWTLHRRTDQGHGHPVRTGLPGVRAEPTPAEKGLKPNPLGSNRCQLRRGLPLCIRLSPSRIFHPQQASSLSPATSVATR